ncbi:ComF family protein [Croceivirga sp. JEA036]|nr:ComF family protein [Croceivirga sp. JEA036]NJB36875.1 ComF family protein [Croceivirga sp. JEA036]
MILNWSSNIINDINSILLPKLCFGCNEQLFRGEHILCTFCRHDLPFTDQNFSEENAVDRIFYGRAHISKAASFLYFHKNGKAKQLLHALKYQNQEQIGSYFGAWFGQKIANDFANISLAGIVPVPLHPKKLKQRGYNQLDGFGKALAHELNTSYLPQILYKTANTRTQTKKTRLNRWKNVQELYKVKDATQLNGKSILLIDDVITTGATLEACINALHTIPNVNIYVATLAVVP